MITHDNHQENTVADISLACVKRRPICIISNVGHFDIIRKMYLNILQKLETQQLN